MLVPKEQTQIVIFSHIFWYFPDALIGNKLNLCCWSFYSLEEPTDWQQISWTVGSARVLPVGYSGPWGSRMERLVEKTVGTSALCQDSSAWTTSTAAPEASGSVRKHCGSCPYMKQEGPHCLVQHRGGVISIKTYQAQCERAPPHILLHMPDV